ncbi:suppressor of fused domain protein [Marmoricola sp. RAF53]|uniref:suppressor of fused domain protein n=1 Tax=Marmoricola sp. RAF53 TaxID=3233059 RepID=UPI003F9524BB
MATSVERYLAHLDHLSGGVEPEFFRIGSHDAGPSVTTIVYRDLPETGLLTAFTYGLSLADHPEWRTGRPELCISMQSDEVAWGLAVGHLASTLAGDCPFRYGDTIDVGEPITAGTRMSAFLVFAPSVVDREGYLNVLGEPEGAAPSQVVNIAGMYPIHQSEREFIRAEGLEAFWKLDWDPYDPLRDPVV